MQINKKSMYRENKRHNLLRNKLDQTRTPKNPSGGKTNIDGKLAYAVIDGSAGYVFSYYMSFFFLG